MRHCTMAPRHHLHSLDEEQPLVDSEPTYQNSDSYLALINDNANGNSSSNSNANNSGSNCAEEERIKKKKLTGTLLLLFVALLYGTLNVTLRWIYAFTDPPSASAISTARGWLAVLCFAPFLLHKKYQTTTITNTTSTITNCEEVNGDCNHNASAVPPRRELWKIAAELAVWNFGAQGLTNLGLTYIESARASFLTQLSVVMTPLISALCGTKVHMQVWWACGLALAGLVLLSEDGGVGIRLGLGDFMCLGGAFSWAMYIVRLSAIGGEHYNEVDLQALKTFFLAIFYTAWCVAETLQTGQCQWLGWSNLAAWGLLFYSALGPGAVADLIQQKGQAIVAATVSNVLLSTEPVFTAIFGRILLGEETSWFEKLGGCLILIAAMIATKEETSEGGSVN